mgnify:CR=1 FL=1
MNLSSGRRLRPGIGPWRLGRGSRLTALHGLVLYPGKEFLGDLGDPRLPSPLLRDFPDDGPEERRGPFQASLRIGRPANGGRVFGGRNGHSGPVFRREAGPGYELLVRRPEPFAENHGQGAVDAQSQIRVRVEYAPEVGLRNLQDLRLFGCRDRR